MALSEPIPFAQLLVAELPRLNQGVIIREWECQGIRGRLGMGHPAGQLGN